MRPCARIDMKTYNLKIEQCFPRPLEEVFSFFADAHNLEVITPPWLHFQTLTPGPIEMKRGTLIDYRLRLHGVPVRWQSEITAWDAPHRFVDVQCRGPYRLWIHEHTFVACNDGLLVRDEIEYAVPGGVLVQKLLAAPELKKIFDYRCQKLQEIFGSARLRE